MVPADLGWAPTRPCLTPTPTPAGRVGDPTYRETRPADGISQSARVPARSGSGRPIGPRSTSRSTRSLEAAEIQRRVYASGGPAVLFANVASCRFPMVSNLFGTLERARYLFRDTLDRVRRLIELKLDASAGAAPPDALPGRAAGRAAHAAAARGRRAGAGPRDDDRPTAAVEVLAGRRRRVHHAAAGLHGGRRAAGADAVEPGHVSRPAVRRPVRAEPRGRLALPTPPRDRRPSCGGHSRRAGRSG